MRQLIILSLLSVLCSCNSKSTEQLNAVSSLVGREIFMPDSLTCQILNDTIVFSFGDADYTIVEYIDSAGCTPCRMKLQEWNNLINQLMAIQDVDVNFVMVINSPETEELDYIIKRDNFLHPICFDSVGDFAIRNQLPEKDTYHTFLLDENNDIVLVGNPAINPKIRELYRSVVIGDVDEDRKAISKPLGAIKAGASIVKQFEVHNGDTCLLTIQEVVPSCDCVSATINIDTIQPDQSGILTMKYVADSISGPISRYVDVYFNEKENPVRYFVHGFVITNPY